MGGLFQDDSVKRFRFSPRPVCPRRFEYFSSPSMPLAIGPLIRNPQIPLPYRVCGNTVKMERILPVPKIVRRVLNARFYGHEQQLDSTGDENLPCSSIGWSLVGRLERA